MSGRQSLAALLVVPSVIVAAATPAVAGPAVARPITLDPGQTATTGQRTRPVAPGIRLTSFSRSNKSGRVRGYVLTVDLSKVHTGYLSPGRVAAGAPLSKQADRLGAVAGVNADYFDIGHTEAPNGAAIDHGRLVKSALPGWTPTSAGVDAGGLGHIANVLLEGKVSLPGGHSAALTQLNSPFVDKNGLGAFTPLWGSASRERVAEDGAKQVAEALVVGGKVVSVSDKLGSGQIPGNGFVLVGRESGSAVVRRLQKGDQVSLHYRAKTSKRLVFSVGGRQKLVTDGKIESNPEPARHPRTAIGFSQNDRTMYLMAVDGRQSASRGVTLAELARLMKDTGAYSALNLDGGGSTTLVARNPGAEHVQVQNHPSDGHERSVPNGIGLYAPKGSGRLRSFWVETAGDSMNIAGPAPARGVRPDRVFAGLTRKLVARGQDEAFGPAAGSPRWSARGAQGSVDATGLFRPQSTGDAHVTAADGKAHGDLDLTVLGSLARIGTTVNRFDPSEEIWRDRTTRDDKKTGWFGVVGFDPQSVTAPIEPSDAKLAYDPALLTVSPADDGGFRVAARRSSATTQVTVEVAGHRTVLPVRVGPDGKVDVG